jgi:hypothetical protein
MNLFERSGACTREARPELNSRDSGVMSGAASGEQAPLKGRGELGGGNPNSLLRAFTCEQKTLLERFPTPGVK